MDFVPDADITPSCSICLSTFTSLTENFCTTSCNHCFHFSCIAKHIESEKNECPLCRHVLFEKKPITESSSPAIDTYYDELPTDTDTDTDTNNFDIHVDEFMINRITNHLVRSEISYKQLVTSLCFIEHDEFSGNDTFINNSDYIFGKIRQILNAIQPPP